MNSNGRNHLIHNSTGNTNVMTLNFSSKYRDVFIRVSSIKKIITRKGLPMLFVKLEDLTDKVEVVVFPSVLERNPVVFQENKVVLVAGRVDQRDNTPKIICEEIEEIINK